MNMSRKSFLIWGLAIIIIIPLATAAVRLLALSDIIPNDESLDFMNQASGAILLAHLTLVPLFFGVIIYLRFKEIGRRKRTLAVCLLLFAFAFLFSVTPNALTSFYDDHMIKDSGTMTRFWDALAETGKQGTSKSDSPWTLKHAIDFSLIHLLGDFISQIGLFALLAFGSLDPRTPSKNRVIQFFKTGFKFKDRPKTAKVTKLAGA